MLLFWTNSFAHLAISTRNLRRESPTFCWTNETKYRTASESLVETWKFTHFREEQCKLNQGAHCVQIRSRLWITCELLVQTEFNSCFRSPSFGLSWKCTWRHLNNPPTVQYKNSKFCSDLSKYDEFKHVLFNCSYFNSRIPRIPSVQRRNLEGYKNNLAV